MKTQKISIDWDLQPAHGESKTFLHDGKMFVKVGPHDDVEEIRFVAHGIQSVSDKLEFDNTDDAYSYFNQRWCDREEKETK